MADAVGFLKTSLDNVMSQCDAIVCLAPHTPRTERMIGQRELDLIQPGAVFVNVSRGKVVDSDALVRRLKRGDIVAGLDVFDPDVGEDNAYGDKEILHLRHPSKPSRAIRLRHPHTSPNGSIVVTEQSYPRFFELMVDEAGSLCRVGRRFFHGHETLFDLTPWHSSIANRISTG